MAALTDTAGLPDLLDEIWRVYREMNLTRIGAIERSALALLRGTLNATAREATARDAHKLAGILGTLGSPQGSILAMEAEHALTGDGPIDGKRLAEVAAGLRVEFDARDAGTAPVARSGSTARPAETALDILLVEDDPALADLLSSALRTRGYRTEVLGDGKAARTRMADAEPKPRLMILDVDLPGLDGTSVLRELAGLGALDQTSVIMLTVHASEAEILSTLRLGAVDHVAKPFSLAVLLEKVDRLLDSAEPGAGRAKGVGSEDPVARALAVVGQKWTLLIVRDLIPGPRRFTEIQRSLGADPKVITARLRELAAGGLISRTAYAEVPPRVEYALTEPGRALEAVVDSLRRWGSTRAIRPATSPVGPRTRPGSRARQPSSSAPR